jgi:uncharacterized protein YdaU (DUF1376 family)
LIQIKVSVRLQPHFSKKAEGYESKRVTELTAWYREFAKRAGEAAIRAARLRTAKELGAEADRLGAKPASKRQEATTN